VLLHSHLHIYSAFFFHHPNPLCFEWNGKKFNSLGILHFWWKTTN
jgi:hypothetical protein